MQKVLILSFLLLTLAAVSSFGQSSEKSKGENSFAPVEEEQPSAIQRKTMKKRGKKSAKSVFNKKMDRKIEEFDKRMAANAKADRKERRLMSKPQYSDPSYFGHKRKPKKREVGKRKFCKECSLWH